MQEVVAMELVGTRRCRRERDVHAGATGNLDLAVDDLGLVTRFDSRRSEKLRCVETVAAMRRVGQAQVIRSIGMQLKRAGRELVVRQLDLNGIARCGARCKQERNGKK